MSWGLLEAMIVEGFLTAIYMREGVVGYGRPWTITNEWTRQGRVTELIDFSHIIGASS